MTDQTKAARDVLVDKRDYAKKCRDAARNQRKRKLEAWWGRNATYYDMLILRHDDAQKNGRDGV